MDQTNGDVSVYNTWCGRYFTYGSGTRDNVLDLETQFIKRLCLRLRYCTRPNPHEILVHLRDHRFKFGSNSAGDIISGEYGNLPQNTTERLAHLGREGAVSSHQSRTVWSDYHGLACGLSKCNRPVTV